MNNDELCNLLNESLQRCLENDQFLIIFYKLFLESSDEIKDKFSGIDEEHQINMMRQSLNTIISVSEANWESDKFLSDMAIKHKDMNIKPELYTLWQSSLLSAVSKCDKQYNEDIRKAWTYILSRGIEFMQMS